MRINQNINRIIGSCAVVDFGAIIDFGKIF
jgi:hypothetical protein